MKLLDLLVKELPHRGGWPKTMEDVRNVMTAMEAHELTFEARPWRQWFYDKHGVTVTERQYETEIDRLKNITELSVNIDSSFDAAAKQLMKWINDNGHPHQTIIIDATSAVLYSGEKSITTEEFIKD